MHLKAGIIVRSVSGHDKDNFYILLNVNGCFGHIVDGKRRKLIKPKLKNLKHVKPTHFNVDLSALENDCKVRKIIRTYTAENGGNS